MKIGDTFYFAGNWNTCEGRWQVVSHVDETRMVKCEPISGEAERYHKGDDNMFFASFVDRMIDSAR